MSGYENQNPLTNLIQVEWEPLKLKPLMLAPINGKPVGDYDTVVDACGVEWFFDQSGHLDVFGSEWGEEGASGYHSRSLNEAIDQLTEDGYFDGAIDDFEFVEVL